MVISSTENNMFILDPMTSSNKASEDNVDDVLTSKIEELTKIRKSIALDLKSIASATKISTNQLKNIENLNFEKLPPHPMRESFIDQYCKEIEKAKSSS